MLFLFLFDWLFIYLNHCLSLSLFFVFLIFFCYFLSQSLILFQSF